MKDRIRCYDNGGKTFDQYTIVFMDRPERRVIGCPPLFEALGASEHPFHPQGFGQHVPAAPGKHLGRRVAMETLPPDVQKFIQQNIED